MVPETGDRCFSEGGSDCGPVAWQRPDKELRLEGNELRRFNLKEE